jgi:antitoxin component YwqK of YwqJK toxin-antitoxin module
MKKSILLLAFSIVLTVLSAQELQLQDGKAFKDDQLFTGVDVTFFMGTEQIETECPYSKGVKDGVEVFYHKNGAKKAERIWKKGLKDGVWINWNEEGQQTAQASYSKNKKDGDWFIWSDKGILLFEMHYKKGEKIGKWKQWKEDGELIMEKDF